MPEHDLTGAVWRTSSRSDGPADGVADDDGACVEVATNLPGIVAVRDSKDREGAVLVFTLAEWDAFLGGVNDGEFDL